MVKSLGFDAANGVAILTAALALCAGCAAQKNPYTAAEIGQDNAVIDALFATWDVPGSPGCALAVARNGTPIYTRGYGYANLDYDIPITPQTVFDVASVTKQFNAASLAMLELDGKLTLQDDVRRWLPELPEYGQPITLRHMLDHSSGLRDYLTLFPLAGRDDYYPISHPQILAMMSRQRSLNSQPGEKYAYSNTAYMLLAQVIERASGQSFGEFTVERIFESLRMNDSFMYDNLEKVVPRRATGYFLQDDGSARIVHNYNFDIAGDGQLYTTMEDLLRWDEYLHGAKQPPIYSRMLTERYLNDGEAIEDAQGIRRRLYRGLETVGHSGSSWGFRTELVRFVEAGLTIAISCNMDNSGPQQLAKRVADHFLQEEMGPNPEVADETPEAQSEISTPTKLTATQIVAYAGSFYSPELDTRYRLAVNDGALALRIAQELPVTVVPLGDDRFEFGFHPDGWSGPALVLLEFRRNDVGHVAGFELNLGFAQGIVFKKSLETHSDR